MKLKYLLYLLLFAITIDFGFAQDTTFSDKYFKLVKSYNTLDEVYQAHPELKPKPPHIVIEDDKVLFYDDNGEVINSMPAREIEDIPETDTLYEKYHNKYKISRNFRTVDGELLVIAKSYGNEISPYPFRSLTEVYDKTGKLLVTLCEDTGVKISPDKRFFATSYEGEAGMGLVQIFDISGKEICTYKSKNELSINYDINNNLVINGINDFIVVVKDTLCNDLVSYNYFRNLNINYIASAYYSIDFNQFLLSTLHKIFYIDNKNSKLLWDKHFDYAINCIFNKGKNYLIVISQKSFKGNTPPILNIKVISINNGISLSTIPIEKLISINNNLIILEEGGRYYEYEI